jgi:hypothetical protein
LTVPIDGRECEWDALDICSFANNGRPLKVPSFSISDFSDFDLILILKDLIIEFAPTAGSLS